MRKTDKTILAAVCGGLLLAVGMARAAAPQDASTTAAPAAASAAPAMSQSKSEAAAAEVARAQFTTAIADHEPTDDVATLDNSHTRIYFFTDLRNMAGQTVIHRWSFNGNTVAEVKLEPKAARWRTYSSKNLDPVMTGTWSVEVLDSAGNVLAKKSFEYTRAAAADDAATH